jgi:hypothetical protein
MMSDFTIKVDTAATIRALSLDMSKAEAAGFYALGQVALAVERQAKLNAVQGGTHKRGTKTPATPGSGPARITGALQRSIHTEVRKGFGTYEASVFPTMVYSRAVELGSPRWSSGVKYPYLIPAGVAIEKRANDIFTQAMARKWHG